MYFFSSAASSSQYYSDYMPRGSGGHGSHVDPEPSQYTNFLELNGYVVEIVGGKHFTTPKGEFVEMKSGTQYKIFVKNMHNEGRFTYCIPLGLSCVYIHISTSTGGPGLGEGWGDSRYKGMYENSK